MEYIEHPTAYGQNIRGFHSFIPNPFGCNPDKMVQYYNEMYVYPNPRSPISQATIAGAAAYKAVQDSPKVARMPLINGSNLNSFHSQAISNVRANAAQEARILLQRYPLPGVDPVMILISAEEGAHRLYNHVMSFD